MGLSFGVNGVMSKWALVFSSPARDILYYSSTTDITFAPNFMQVLWGNLLFVYHALYNALFLRIVENRIPLPTSPKWRIRFNLPEPKVQASSLICPFSICVLYFLLSILTVSYIPQKHWYTSRSWCNTFRIYKIGQEETQVSMIILYQLPWILTL